MNDASCSTILLSNLVRPPVQVLGRYDAHMSRYGAAYWLDNAFQCDSQYLSVYAPRASLDPTLTAHVCIDEFGYRMYYTNGVEVAIGVV